MPTAQLLCLQAVLDAAAVSAFFSECASLRCALGGGAAARSAGRRMAVQGAYASAQQKPPLSHTPGLTLGPTPPSASPYPSLQVDHCPILCSRHYILITAWLLLRLCVVSFMRPALGWHAPSRCHSHAMGVEVAWTRPRKRSCGVFAFVFLTSIDTALRPANNC